MYKRIADEIVGVREHINMKNNVACIVLNYKDADETIKYVNSIYKFNCYDEIIVVDNCSPDDSFERLQKLQNEKIYVFQTEENKGYGYGNNYGVRKAVELFQCDIAFISNPDITYTEKSVENILKIFEVDSLCALASSIQYNGFTQKRIKNFAWKIPTFTSYVVSSLKIAGRLFVHHSYQLDEQYKKVDCVPGAFLAVRTSCFLESGGYDERIFLYCEESILGYRLKERGFHSYLLTDERYYHYVSTSIKKSIPNQAARYKLVLQNRMFYLMEYLKINPIQKKFAKICFRIAVMEEYLKNFIFCKNGD